MEIYFVRHGQTIGNLAKRHQAENTPLSEEGEAQAAETAKLIAELKPTHLISSHLVRAIESARPISEATNLDMQVEANFAELFRPRYLHGRKHLSAQSVFYYAAWFFGIENQKLAGESYTQVRHRVAMTQNFLKRFPTDARVVVVSHSVFINMFLAHMCRPRSLSIFKLLAFVSKVYRIPNASIRHVNYNPELEHGCRWTQVESINTQQLVGKN